MLSRKDVLENPTLRTWVVKTLFRRLLKEKKTVFDRKVEKNVEEFLIEFRK